MRILVIEDEPQLAELIREHLARSAFAVDLAGTLDEADSALATSVFDAVILDLNLPDGDGLDLLKRLRKSGNTVPVLAATARDEIDERIRGLNLGMDDYLTKPFDLGELTARLRALLRRPGRALSMVLSAGNVTLDSAQMAVEVDGKPLVLGRRQLVLLETLMRSSGRVVSRHAIEEQMYSIDELIESNALEAHVSRLRKALADAGANIVVHTVRGVGYMLSESRP